MENRENNKISSDIIAELTKIVLRSNIFEFDEKIFKQKFGTTIGTKLTPLYAILFTTDLVKKVSENFEKKNNYLADDIDDIFFIWEHGQ